VEKDRMEIFDANVLIQFFTEENSIVMSAEPTLACYSKFFQPTKYRINETQNCFSAHKERYGFMLNRDWVEMNFYEF